MPLHASPFARRCNAPRTSSTRPLRSAQSGLLPTARDSWPLLTLAVLAALTALPARRRTWSRERTTPGMPRLPSLTVQMQNSVETLRTSRYQPQARRIHVFWGSTVCWTSTLRTSTTHTQSRQHRTEKEKHNAAAAITRH